MSYEILEKTFYRLAQLDHAGAMLGWDQAVMMPPAGNESRGRALAELQVMTTEILQDPALQDHMQRALADAASLPPWQQANLREMVNDIKSANAIPKELVEATVLATNECEHAWRSLRPANDWQTFEPMLTKVVDLTRETAQLRRAALADEKGLVSDYEALVDIYDPGTRLAVIDPVFDRLKADLPTLLQEITARQTRAPAPLQPQSTIDKHRQIALSRELMSILGFDFERGRLDETAHPFSGGVSDDSRVTSRYVESNVFEGIMAIVHETGHSRYESGLNPAWRYKPVGGSMGMGVHESQSLFFEMQIGRSRPFVQAIAPIIRKHFGNDPAFSPDNLYACYTRVAPGLIRVNADEVTYPLHVIARYEIERDLINREVKVADIPELWNAAMDQYLGLDTRGNHKDGAMQDIHWPSGAIGYFPSYTLGAINAAQLYRAMLRDIPDVSGCIGNLTLTPIFEWLSERVWRHGRLYSYDELMKRATGETLNADHFLSHLRARYLESEASG